MKKILWFSMSLGVSVLVFALTVFLCFILSSLGTEPVTEPKNSKFDEPFVLDVMVVFVDEPTERYFTSVLSINMNEETVSAKTLDCNMTSGDKTFVEIYKTEGFYPFVAACQNAVGNERLGFIKLNSNTFVTITDRLGKIVYNDSVNGQMLLTSRQAEQRLSKETFSDICVLVAERVFKSGVIEEFLFITNITRNNLSYPRLYSKLYPDRMGDI